MFSHVLRATAVLLIIMPAMAELAEQRALLVGVGKYSIPGIDLPGIDLDLERMHDTLNLMGFDDSQIHSLLDDKATSKNIVREFEIWLKQGVKAEDRVIFYFSGHGSNTPDLNGDEADGVDEVGPGAFRCADDTSVAAGGGDADHRLARTDEDKRRRQHRCGLAVMGHDAVPRRVAAEMVERQCGQPVVQERAWTSPIWYESGESTHSPKPAVPGKL